MRVILVPGLWLDASSWDPVLPPLVAAGHDLTPVTLPGVGAPASESQHLGIADWVDAIVDLVDASEDPVVLVGHSGGGNVVWGVADRRPDAVAQVILVDTLPPVPGGTIWEFPVIDGVIPFPGWDFFDAAETNDLGEELRADAASRTRAVPARVPTDPISLENTARRRIPTTIVMATASAEDLRDIIAAAPDWAAELAAVENLEIVEITAGHWPQLSMPTELGQRIAAAIRLV